MPPLAERVVVLPGQIDPELEEEVMVGTGFARILMVPVPRQVPFETATV